MVLAQLGSSQSFARTVIVCRRRDDLHEYEVCTSNIRRYYYSVCLYTRTWTLAGKYLGDAAIILDYLG